MIYSVTLIFELKLSPCKYTKLEVGKNCVISEAEALLHVVEVMLGRGRMVKLKTTLRGARKYPFRIIPYLEF